MNEELNKLAIYKEKACVQCGRRYPETVLNIEGFIHHKQPLVCLDRKACERAKRRQKT